MFEFKEYGVPNQLKICECVGCDLGSTYLVYDVELRGRIVCPAHADEVPDNLRIVEKLNKLVKKSDG